MEYIHLNIKYLISKNNLTQDTFATIFNITRGKTSHWTTGRTPPTIKEAKEICKYFQISLDDFVNTNLEEKDKYPSLIGGLHAFNERMAKERGESYEVPNKLLEMLEKQLQDKEEIIKLQKQRLADLETKTKRQAG